MNSAQNWMVCAFISSDLTAKEYEDTKETVHK